MEEKLKNKWVKALRSGKYYQAKESLRNSAFVKSDEDGYPLPEFADIEGETGYCCLGVLCEVTPGIEWDGSNYNVTGKKLLKFFPRIPDGGEEDWEWSGYDSETELPAKDAVVRISGEAMPTPLMKHFGLNKTVKQQGVSKTLQSKLINMNDAYDIVGFDKIANYIEKVL